MSLLMKPQYLKITQKDLILQHCKEQSDFIGKVKIFEFSRQKSRLKSKLNLREFWRENSK